MNYEDYKAAADYYALLAACPVCQAAVGQWCQTKLGVKRRHGAHVQRIFIAAPAAIKYLENKILDCKATINSAERELESLEL